MSVGKVATLVATNPAVVVSADDERVGLAKKGTSAIHVSLAVDDVAGAQDPIDAFRFQSVERQMEEMREVLTRTSAKGESARVM